MMDLACLIERMSIDFEKYSLHHKFIECLKAGTGTNFLKRKFEPVPTFTDDELKRGYR